MRCPNRRTFLKLLADPAYGRVEPYKVMAAELDLVPTSGDAVVPDLRWLVGGDLVIVYLLTGWMRAVRS